MTAVGLAGAVERGAMVPLAPVEPRSDDLLRMPLLTALRRHWRILAKGGGPAAGLAVAVLAILWLVGVVGETGHRTADP